MSTVTGCGPARNAGSTAGTLFTGPITVSNTTTIKAIAFKSGLTNSTVSSATYTSSQQLPPTISPSGGIYTAPLSVTLGAYKQNTTLYYSTDGSVPTNTAGTLYSGPVTVNRTSTINAVAYTPCIAPSSVTTATYVIQAVAPVFSPSGGTYTGPQTVVLSTSTSGASIRYTTDGSVPSGTIGALYTGPITVGVTTTINAVAYKSGLLNSAVSSATYTIRPILVTLAPSAVSLYQSATQQFTATVTNTTNTAVTWALSPSGVGNISAGGLYAAPGSIAAQQTVTVTATSQADTTKSASASVTLMPEVTVAPATATLYGGQTRQFASNQAVSWSVSPAGVGAIDASGLYTAPAAIASQQSVTITATSQANATKSAVASVTLMPPVAVSITPSSATLHGGQTQPFTATVTNTTNTSVTWLASIGTVDGSGLYTAPTTVNGQLTATITVTSQADATKSATATVTLMPTVAVSVTPSTATLSAGQTQRFMTAVINSDNQAVTWSISPSDAGTIDATGLYTTPDPIASQQTVTVTATSQADTTASASATVTLAPPPPAITAVTPKLAPVGLTQTVTISGTNTAFVQGQTQVDFGSNIGVSNVNVVTPTQLTADVLPGFGAAPGLRGITVTTGTASVSMGAALTITGPAISITSPPNLSFVNTPTITVSGQVGDPMAVVTMNGVETANVGGNFSAGVPLSEGNNTISVAARSAGWATSTAVIQINLDTTPPHLAIVAPPSGTQTAETSITVAGMVNDIVVGTVNDQDAQVTVNGVAATVLNRSFSAVVPLSPGQNNIQAVARDRVGNIATASVTVQKVASSQLQVVSGNGQSGAVQIPLAQPLVVKVLDAGGAPAPNRTVVFTVTGNNGTVSVAPASGVGKPSIAVTTDADGQAQAFWTLGSHAGAGNNRVEVSSPGAPGLVSFSALGVAAGADKIVVDSGLNQTGAVGEVLPLPFVGVVVDAGSNRLAHIPVTFTVTKGGGTLSGTAAKLNSAAASALTSSRDGRLLRAAPRVESGSSSVGGSVTMITDGDGRVAAFLQLGPDEGRSNNVVQATFGGNAGAPATFVASGLVAGNPAQTSVTGVVLDNSNVPIPGVTMRLLALSQGTNGNVPVEVVPAVQTDSQGQFTITQTPTGVFKLMADGTTATVTGKKYPTLEFDVTTVAGRSATVGMPIYLQSLDTVNQLCVSETIGGTLTLPAFPGFALTVAAGSATFPGGSRSGCISATPVNPDKVPMAPGFGQQPRFILTIQPVGTSFNPPAAITIPNLEGLPPRAVTELYSYDHDLASFVAIGTGTVSADGSVIASDPGVGVLKAGWHCGGDPNADGTVADCPDCQKCNHDTHECESDPDKENKTCSLPPGSGVCVNGTCQPWEYDPGASITDSDPTSGGVWSVPVVKDNIGVSAGEQVTFNISLADKDRKRRKGTQNWQDFVGEGPYSGKLTIDGPASWRTPNSGRKDFQFPTPGLQSGNAYLFVDKPWPDDQPLITVTATVLDNVRAPAAPDVGSKKDQDFTLKWTLKKRTGCPGSMRTSLICVGCGRPNEATPDPATYLYDMLAAPNPAPPGPFPHYKGQTILETFAQHPAAFFTMDDLIPGYRAEHPDQTSPDVVAAFLWPGSQNGTFVIDGSDEIQDRHSMGFQGFWGAVFTSDALKRGVGFVESQTYTCDSNPIQGYTIKYAYTDGLVMVTKSGP